MSNALTNPAVRESGPGADCFAITPSDAVVQPFFRGIYVGGAGNITLLNRAGVSVTFVGLPVGYVLPCQARWVMAATTATNLVGLVWAVFIGIGINLMFGGGSGTVPANAILDETGAAILDENGYFVLQDP